MKLVVEREREIQDFESASFFKVTGKFLTPENKALDAELSKQLKSEDEALKLLELLKSSIYAVGDIEVKPGKKSPSAPFTTSSARSQ